MAKAFHILLFFIVFLFGINSVFAQKADIVQFSGFIQATGTDIYVPYVTVTNHSYGNRTYMSNEEGYFTFVAHKGDSITFSSIGYKSVELIIPKVEGDKYTVHIDMQSQVRELPVVTIGPPLPWASIEEFTAEFLALGVVADDVLSAQRNLSPYTLQSLYNIAPRNAGEIHSYQNMTRHFGQSNRNMNQNAYSTLMNPFAWGHLINQIIKGDFSREKLKY